MKKDVARLENDHGQTLIEVVVALSVLVIILLAVVSVLSKSVKNAAYSRNYSLATGYTQEAIEKIRLYRDQHNWATFLTDCNNIPGLVVPPAPFTRATSCSCTGTPTDTCEVTTSVSWTDSTGTHRSESKTNFTNWK